MKNIGFIYTSDQRFEELISANDLHPDQEYLIRIHTCIHNVRTIRPFINKILSYLPKAKIIGSSTSGVIFKGEIMTACCLVSITKFDNSFVKTASSMISDNEGNDIAGDLIADKMIRKIVNENTKFVLAFAARQFIKVDEFVDHFNSVDPKVQLLGGVADSAAAPVANTAIIESFVFTEKGVYQNSVVCAAIDSDILSVYSDAVYVTEPVGNPHTITGTDRNIIRSIDNKDAVKWYEEILGVSFEDENNASDLTLLFPLVKSGKNNTPLPVFYSPQNEKEKAFPDEPNPLIYMLSEPKVGDKVRISYSSVQKTINICEKVYKELCCHPAEVLFGYTCVSRQDIFSNSAKWELMPFKKTNMCGAMVAGEFANIKNKNTYLAFSFSIAALAENECSLKLDISSLSERSNDLIGRNSTIIDYLLKHSDDTVTENAISTHQEIEKKLFSFNNTDFGNVTKLMYDISSGKLDKICMVTIKNENLIKAFMSENEFSVCYDQFINTIVDYIGNKHYFFYLSSETTLIIAAEPTVSGDDFSKQMRVIQSILTEFTFSSYVPVCEFALVINEDDMIKKAELTLNTMRSKRTCFLTYTSDLGMEKYNAQKMKMIMILSNAISNDLVVPYFQGIRDNSRGGIYMYESLMRIKDANGNVYTPYHFMDIAKEYGYYSDISHIMINKVMEIFRFRKENVTINMNISDVYNYKIVHSILEFLRTAPHPENFVFELTETEEIVDYQIVFEFVQKIHQLGGKIAIDDFGSGFSNIVHVFKIPSDFIKIDGEIIKNITSDIYAREFLEMISTWSRKHSKEIIAEFVENSNIQNIIERNGIRFSQGYLYSKPTMLF